MDNIVYPIPSTLDGIAQQKAELLRQIRLQKELMGNIVKDIFAPAAPAANKAGSVMKAFNTGMAVFDGIVLGFRFLKNFRNFFRKKKRR